MPLLEVFSIPLPGIISAVHEHSIPIFARVGLRSENCFIEYDTVLHFDASLSQIFSIMIDDRLVRIGVFALKWSVALSHTLFL
jgi:hypothetical protein